MTDSEKLDYIIRLLHQLVPNPGYTKAPDGTWRNITTGENQYDEQQRVVKNHWEGK